MTSRTFRGRDLPSVRAATRHGCTVRRIRRIPGHTAERVCILTLGRGPSICCDQIAIPSEEGAA